MTSFAIVPTPPANRVPIRAAVLDLLALAAPRPAALGGPSEEEAEFLETLRRIVARSAAEELLDKYRAPVSDARARVFARYRD
ncbi:gamma-glutamylcysteine synthetase [Amaricoccus macauensis]|uniref:Gamma-glutamylcysteine synthetase n=1 Tax=Amaricoccus macauensis TaxID=57001 RepID=A0A840SS79_9RHOB|nr:hypothetical protein [Amaricoccus macauensis]MBB5223620.1 gamma-glutamylcysteine synthetase [Amaricoccus macauensis]